MPVISHLMSALKKKYGTKQGKSVYYAMENKNSKPFQKALRTAKREGKGHISKTSKKATRK